MISGFFVATPLPAAGTSGGTGGRYGKGAGLKSSPSPQLRGYVHFTDDETEKFKMIDDVLREPRGVGIRMR